jgi:ATP-dependent exoDNAse (exonuclease V) beta subunit
VAVGDFQSDADDDHALREREETKRLLYVALTRARDRLYLGTVLKDGVMQPGRGSLGEVLPASFRATFAATADATEWRASSGAVHPFRVCSPFASEPGAVAVRESGPPLPKASARRLEGDDFAPLVDTTPAPHIVDESDGMDSTLVPAILERLGYTSGERWHDVPFSMRINGSVWRGAIDCLIQTTPESLTVLEFKTGSRRPEHETQLDLYREATARLFPGMTIEARLIYADPDHRTFDAERDRVPGAAESA